ncbi:MAG: tetratricopeptide repeat protein, partial [Terriglobia bacterium]
FQFPPIRSGICRVEVECPRCGKIAAKTLVIENEGNLNVNFVVRRQSEGQTARSDLLGPVSFYTNPDYKTSGLEDPSAGGGYSDSASRQAGQMVSQYLARDTAPSPSRSAHEGNLMDAPSLSEASLEGSGRALLAKGKFTQAIRVFETAVARYPRSERLRMGLGLSLYGAGKFPAAGQALREAARLAPDDPSPILMLAEASRFAPNSETSRLLKRFSDLHPQSRAGHYAYGLALWGDYRSRHDARVLAQAQHQFEKALALDGNSSDAHLRLGMVYDEQGATQRAIHEYLKAIQVSPALAIAHYRLAQDYERAGERDKAAAEIARYEKLRSHASP